MRVMRKRIAMMRGPKLKLVFFNFSGKGLLQFRFVTYTMTQKMKNSNVRASKTGYDTLADISGPVYVVIWPVVVLGPVVFMLTGSVIQKTFHDSEDGVMREIDAGYANPVVLAQMFPQWTFRQTPDSVLYTIEPVEQYSQAIRSYVKKVQGFFPENGKVVVSAGGSTQIVAAFYWAVSRVLGSARIKSSTGPPIYLLHEEIANTISNCRWVPYDQSADLIVVVSPNNPNGLIQSYPMDATDKTFVLLDSVYDRPQFTSTQTVNPWKMQQYANPRFCEVNSFSKEGLAGLRVGYAITTDTTLYDLMVEYIKTTSLGTNTWAMKNVLHNIPTVLSDPSFYRNGYALFQHRHQQIRRVVPQNKIYSNDVVPLLFVQIPFDRFAPAGIIARPGRVFGMTDQFTRLNLMISDEDFAWLLQRLSNIVS